MAMPQTRMPQFATFDVEMLQRDVEHRFKLHEMNLESFRAELDYKLRDLEWRIVAKLGLGLVVGLGLVIMILTA